MKFSNMESKNENYGNQNIMATNNHGDKEPIVISGSIPHGDFKRELRKLHDDLNKEVS